MIPRLRLCFSFWAYPVLAAALLYAGLAGAPELGGLAVVALLASGVVSWTVIEYLLHRFVFHPETGRGARERLAERLHGVHHRVPKDPNEILAGPEVSLPPSAVVFGLLLLGTGSLPVAAVVMTGIWGGFLCYEGVHYAVHTSHAQGLLRRHRRWHFHHHFVDAGVHYGVTSPLWDSVFATRRKRPRGPKHQRFTRSGRPS